MASSVIKPHGIYTVGVAGASTITFPVVAGQIMFLSRSSVGIVGIVGMIAVDMVSGITYYGNNTFLSNISAAISDGNITINNAAGVALQITILRP